MSTFELYRTNRFNTFGTTSELFYYDCLLYRVTNTIVAYGNQESRGIISYCMRPLLLNNFSGMKNGSVGVIIPFGHLRKKGVREVDLLSWSAPLDLVELYIQYLENADEFSSVTDQSFFNCTSSWFGSHCEYTFETVDESFDNIVTATFRAKDPYWNNHLEIMKPLDYTNLSCYIHLKCRRGPGLANCLDWREVCDGKVDCIGDGEDERDCLEMEVNECAHNEYRCHNGMCIPPMFYHDNRFNPDCLDSTDEFVHDYTNCFKDPGFRCEEADHPFHRMEGKYIKDNHPHKKRNFTKTIKNALSSV